MHHINKVSAIPQDCQWVCSRINFNWTKHWYIIGCTTIMMAKEDDMSNEITTRVSPACQTVWGKKYNGMDKMWANRLPEWTTRVECRLELDEETISRDQIDCNCNTWDQKRKPKLCVA